MCLHCELFAISSLLSEIQYMGQRPVPPHELLSSKNKGYIVTKIADLDFPISQAKDYVVLAIGRPDEACDGRGQGKFVADGLLLAPLKPQLVYEDNPISLCYRQLRAVRTKCHPSYCVVLCLYTY